MGHFFLTEATFSGIRMDNTQKMWKIGLHYETCRWKYVPFSAKMTLKSGKGVSKLKRYPLPPAKQIWVRCLVHFSINLFLLLFFVHLFLNPMQYTFILFIYLFIYFSYHDNIHHWVCIHWHNRRCLCSLRNVTAFGWRHSSWSKI